MAPFWMFIISRCVFLCTQWYNNWEPSAYGNNLTWRNTVIEKPWFLGDHWAAGYLARLKPLFQSTNLLTAPSPEFASHRKASHLTAPESAHRSSPPRAPNNTFVDPLHILLLHSSVTKDLSPSETEICPTPHRLCFVSTVFALFVILFIQLTGLPFDLI